MVREAEENKKFYYFAKLKSISKELNVPVIALRNYRAVETRGSVKDLSDLRESGAIEQDADIVSFVSS
jgi:replicative DNA helicase